MNHFVIPLKGLHCQGCVKKLTRAIDEQLDATVTALSTTRLELETTGTKQEVIQTIESCGFSADTPRHFELSGLSCNGCVNKVKKALDANEQIEFADVSKTTLDVVSTLSDEAIVGLIKDVGYQATTDTHIREDKVSNKQASAALTNEDESQKQQTEDKSQTLYFSIEGMTCASCVSSVEKALKSQALDADVSVNLAERSARVASNASLDTDALISAVNNAGYKARLDAQESQQEKDEALTRLYRGFLRSALAGIGIGLPIMLWGVFGGSMNIDSPQAQWYWGIVGVICFFLMATAGRDYYISAWKSLRHRRATMDTLVALGTGAAWCYSMLVVLNPSLFPAQAQHVYFEASAMIIGLISLGHAIETKAKAKTTQALHGLLALQPKETWLVTEQGEKAIPINDVTVGMRLRIKPGERVPVDGIVVKGESYIDESMLTGEAIPIYKEKENSVTAGTLNQDGVLEIEAKGVGAQTRLSHIIELVRSAQSSKPPIAKLVDKISSIFVPVVVAIAILTALIWLFFGPEPTISYMLVTATTVLIIACPCALGLATPLSITAGVGRAAQSGILIKDAQSLQSASTVNTVVFDKTGTLTEGHPRVTDIFVAPSSDKETLIGLAYGVEQHSSHPLAKAICDYAAKHDITATEIENFTTQRGNGVSANWQQKALFVGSEKYLKGKGVDTSAVIQDSQITKNQEQTFVFVALDGQLVGYFAIADAVKESAKEAVAGLKKLGIHTVMLTGDTQGVAHAIAKQLGIDEIIAEVPPEEKANQIKRLQKDGVVAMVGDGINDAPALAQADIGIAMGEGNDIAIESADIALLNNSPTTVLEAIAISKATVKNIHQNLVGAFIYNVIGIPIAAGILYPLFGILLSPVIAGAAMALSSITVVSNANRLRIINIKS